MRKLYIITGILALAIAAHGQVVNPPSIQTSPTNPSGNACTAGVPMLYYAGTYYGCDGTGHYAAVGGSSFSLPSQQFVSGTTSDIGLLNQAPNGNAPVWNRMGVTIDPRVSNCGSGDFGAQERATMYEANAPLVSGQPFEMYYHSAWVTAQVSLATSADGTKYNCQGVVLSGYSMPRHVWRDGSGNVTLYTVNSSNALYKNVSANGTTGWTSTATNLTNVADPYVWQESNQTFAIFTRHTTCWQTYFAYSTDGLTGLNFTEYSGNPIITACSTGSPAGYKDNSSNYWMWMQSSSPYGTIADIPNDLYFFKCTGFIAHTPSCSVQNSSNPSSVRKTADEGISFDSTSQIADPSLVTDGTPSFSGTPSVLANKTIMNYSSVITQSPTSLLPNQIKEFVANMSLAQLVTAAQSDGPPLEPDTSASLVPTKMVLPSGAETPVVIGQGNSAGTMQYANFGGTDRLMIGANLYFSSISATQSRPNTSLGSAFIQSLAASSNDGTSIGSYLLNTAGSTTAALILAQDSAGATTYLWDNTSFLCLGSWFSCPVSLSQRGATGGSGSQPWMLLGNGTANDTSAFLDFSGFRNRESANPSGFYSSGFYSLWDDSTAHRPMFGYNGGPAVTLPGIVAQGTATLASGSISNGTCAAVVTVAATNTTTADSIVFGGYTTSPATADGLLDLSWYTTAGNVNFKLCNGSGASQTASGLTLNWKVIR